MMKRFIETVVFIFCMQIWFSCSRPELTTNLYSGWNSPPVANAGADQSVSELDYAIILNGSGSVDPDNNIGSYSWSKISGPPTFHIANPARSITEVKNFVKGVYQFELLVTDWDGLISKDTVEIEVRIYVIPPDPCAISRTTLEAQLIPIGKLSGSAGPVTVASAGNKIVFAGGWGNNPWGGESSSIVNIHDLTKNTWSKAQLSAGRSGMAVAVSGSKIFFAGGLDTDGWAQSIIYDNVDVYDVSTDTWILSALSEPRSNAVGAAVGNKVIFAGGTDNKHQASNRIDIFNAETGLWSIRLLNEAQVYSAAFTVADKVYFTGAINKDGTASQKIDVYDDSNGSWSLFELSQARSYVTGIGFEGKIYWAGGWNGITLKWVEIYDTHLNTTSLSCLFQPNSGFKAVTKGNQILFFTGNGIENNKFDIYDVVAGTWSIGQLNHTVSGAAIISVNNTIYVAGGTVDNEIYDGVWKLEF